MNAPVSARREGGRSILAAVLVALAVLPYLQTFRHDFVNYDDDVYVTENPHVQHALTSDGVAWAFSTFKGGNWHPITWLSHMLDVSVWGLNAGGHHLTNVMLHAANTLLLFLVLLGMTAKPWRSALVAGLFAVHPLHVESVAWIAERKDVLSAFFGLLALWAYLNYVLSPSIRRYLLIACFFVLSLMAKPMLVTLPFLLLLVDIWPLRRWKLWPIESTTSAEAEVPDAARPRHLEQASIAPHQIILEKVPLLVVGAVFCVVAIISQQAARNISSLSTFSFGTRIANAVVGYDLYLEKLFAPVKLAVFYPHPGHWRAAVVAMSAILLAIVTGTAITLRRKHPWLLVGWLWFIGTLVPVIGLIQVGLQSIADRYAYIPSVGIFIMIAWSIPAPLSSSAQRTWFALASACIGLLSLMTWVQVSYWRDSRTLFTHALAVTHGNFIAHQNLGDVLEREKNFAAALEQYRTAATERPGYGRIHENIANILLKQGRYQDALAELNYAIYRDPFSSTAFNNAGSIMLAGKQYEEAAKHLQRAVELDPDNVAAHINYGTALVKLERWDEAIAELGPITRAEPKRIVARTNLAIALAGRGDFDHALAELREVLRIAPDHAPAREALQRIESQRGQ